MAEKPIAPTGDYELKEIIYSESGYKEVMTDSEFKQGRNNVGEQETPLGSIPNANKENFLFNYLNQHIYYVEKMVEYLDERITQLHNGG